MCKIILCRWRSWPRDSPFAKASDFVPEGLRRASRKAKLGGEFAFSGIELGFEAGENR